MELNSGSTAILHSQHEKIVQLVSEFFEKLPKKGKPLPTEWTTFAAIIQCKKTDDGDLDSTVVCFATGTKCLGQNELSPEGDVVSDSHAEVLARRLFVRYLYEQIDSALVGSKFTILKTLGSSDSSPVPKFAVRDNIWFHLFVSQLPCGDAAIVYKDPPNLITDNTDQEPASKKSKLDSYSESEPVLENRTGAKLQVGPLIYEETQSVGKCRVKPGKGDPTLSMSCSDKIAKWQILGLQGSLLGNFIPSPVRFSSVVIGGSVPFNQISLERALFDRFQSELFSLAKDNEDLRNYLKNYFKPAVAQASFNLKNCFDPNNPKLVPSPSSISCYLTKKREKSVQVLVNGRKQGATKKHFGAVSSMVEVCRKLLFTRFIGILNSNNTNDYKSLSYSEAKAMNTLYSSCWKIIKCNVMEGWTQKPECAVSHS